MINIEIIPCLKDNYSYIIHDDKYNLVGVIDPAEFNPINTFISKKLKKIDFILNTHHHADHVGGNEELKKKYKSKVICSEIDKNRIPAADLGVSEGQVFNFGSISFSIIFVPGHTKGHIAFYSKEEKIIFTGDALFSLGCGRIFEGTQKDMYDSLLKIKNLPVETKIFCGHEYTRNNLEFCFEYEKDSTDLEKKKLWIIDRINNNLPTLPVTLKEELKTNIFLRCDNPDIKKKLNMAGSSDQHIFDKLRSLKDEF